METLKTIFEIPIYALSKEQLNCKYKQYEQKIRAQLTGRPEDIIGQILEIGSYPQRIWEYNHIVGYIRILMNSRDLKVKVFLRCPQINKYFWKSKTKHFLHFRYSADECRYIGGKKTNESIRDEICSELGYVIENIIPKRFYVDRAAFDNTFMHLDYLSIKNTTSTFKENY